MANFVVFNELSLPISDTNWKAELKDYVGSVQRLKEFGINNIRVKTHFREIGSFTQSRSFVEFFNQIPREVQSRIRSMIANEINTYVSPLIAEEESEQIQELTIDSEFYYDGNVVTGGLACAHIWNTLSISFPTKEAWTSNSIPLTKSHILDGDSQIEIANISSSDSCTEHRAALETLVGEITTPAQIIELSSVVNSLYQYKVTFNDEAQTQLTSLHTQSVDLIIKLSEIVKSIKVNPNIGLGKPERLKHIPGSSSRRITEEHRVVYKITDTNLVEISQCIGHY
ncbi:Txe/YoeB family addiction module toxin [Vibrio splendidus]